MTKTHFKKLVNPEFLGAYSLDPDHPEPIYTIKSIEKKMVKGADGKEEELTICGFKEAGVKPMILNVTNMKSIEKVTQSPYIEDWVGKRIRLYSRKVKAFGDTVDALRIREFAPELPDLNPSARNWESVKLKVASGLTIEKVREHFKLSESDAALLIGTK